MITFKTKKPMYFFIWFCLIIYATWAHLYFGNYEANIALSGFSAYDFTNNILFPENFLNDYPGGAASVGKSTLPWLYPILASIGIPPNFTLPFFIALEISVLTYGAFFLLKTLFKDIHPIVLIAITCALSLSHIQLGNLARFGNPFFHGHFYGYADGLRLFAIAYYIRGRHNLSSSILIISFTIHPIKTIFGFIFIMAMHLWKLKSVFTKEVLTPYFIFVCFAILWMYLWIMDNSGSQFISSEEFFRYSPLFNSHWYPQDLNILDKYHQFYSTSFLSSILIGLNILLRSNFQYEIKMQLFLAILITTALVVIGLILSWHEVSPFFVKLSLQRSSVLILAIMSILVFGRLYMDIKSGEWWFAILLFAIVLTPFYYRESWHVVFSLLYAASTLLLVKQKELPNKILKITIISLTIFIVVYELYLYIYNYQNLLYWKLHLLPLSGLILILTIFKLLRFKLTEKNAPIIKLTSSILVTISLVVSAIYWSTNNKTLSPTFIAKGNAYKDVQLWAKNNTSHDALFLIDPTIAYGWRDFSQRSSFGTLNEWYKTGWLYSGSKINFQNGIERGKLFGIDKLIPNRSLKPAREEFINKSYSQALKVFYLSSGKVVANISENNNIDYIVADKVKAPNFGKILAWKIAFQNKFYSVLVPPHIK